MTKPIRRYRVEFNGFEAPRPYLVIYAASERDAKVVASETLGLDWREFTIFEDAP